MSENSKFKPQNKLEGVTHKFTRALTSMREALYDNLISPKPAQSQIFLTGDLTKVRHVSSYWRNRLKDEFKSNAFYDRGAEKGCLVTLNVRRFDLEDTVRQVGTGDPCIRGDFRTSNIDGKNVLTLDLR